jgi:predicted nucleotidyltransferase
LRLILETSYAISRSANTIIDKETRMRFHGVDIPKKRIVDFCQRWNITEFALFGSVLRDDFHPGSDVDVLVTFTEDCGHSLLDLAQMQNELETILAHKVDLVEKAGLRNPFRKSAILNNMEIVYATGAA